MNEFQIWFSTGVEHILDLSGYDHILFVTLLTLTFPFTDWPKLLVLITAFTIGHSVSLALSVSDFIKIPPKGGEFFIAVSILFSGIYNLFERENSVQKNSFILYGIVLLFGLVHGVGFSYLLKSMLGKEQDLILPLLYFNLGLELGQIIIVTIVLVFSLLLTTLFKCPFKIYKLTIVCIITLIALKISAERFLDLF